MSLPSDANTAAGHGAPAHDGRPVTDPAHLLPAHASEGTTGGGRWRKWALLALILAVIGFVVWRIHSNNAATAATNDKTAAAANRPTPVLTAPVEVKSVPVYLTALGTVTAYNTVTLHSRVDGQLLQVNFHEGQNVKQGQLLLQIDPRPYQAAVDQALGTLAKDQANLKNTEAESQRYTALYQAGVVSKESQQTQISNAGQAAGSIKADEAQVEAAKVNLGYTRIYAPISGTVGLRQVDPGNIVHASDATGLVVITQVHPIAIIFTLPEDQIPQVQQAMRGGNKLVVEAYDRNDAHKIAAGTLLTIDNQIDTTTGTAKLKAVFDNTDDALFPNQFVNVRLIIQQLANATVVSSAALQTGTNGSFVYVVHPGPTPANKRPRGTDGAAGASGSKTHTRTAAATDANGAGGSTGNASGSAAGGDGAQRGPAFHVDAVPVAINFTQGTSTVLQNGALKAGDLVVIDGQEKLTDGSNVTPQASHSTAGAAGASGSNSRTIGAAGAGSGSGGSSGATAAGGGRSTGSHGGGE